MLNEYTNWQGFKDFFRGYDYRWETNKSLVSEFADHLYQLFGIWGIVALIVFVILLALSSDAFHGVITLVLATFTRNVMGAANLLSFGAIIALASGSSKLIFAGLKRAVRSLKK